MSKKGKMTKGKPKWRFRANTLRFKRNRKLIVMVFDDRVTYTYAKTVPIYIETLDGEVCRLRDDPVLICDKRTKGDHD